MVRRMADVRRVPVAPARLGVQRGWFSATSPRRRSRPGSATCQPDWAPAGVRCSYTILAQVLDAAVDMGLIAASPAARVRLPRVPRAEMRFLTPVELEVLAAAIDSRWRALVLVMAWATLPIGEAVGLRRVDVDPVAGTLRVANSVVEVDGRLIEDHPRPTPAGGP